jgi:hypothetical protein
VSAKHGFRSRTGQVLRECDDSGKLARLVEEVVGAELDQIREELRRLPPSDVVWDVEDRDKQPPWGDDISDDITDLGNYFVTEDGRDLFDVLIRRLDSAARRD